MSVTHTKKKESRRNFPSGNAEKCETFFIRSRFFREESFGINNVALT